MHHKVALHAELSGYVHWEVLNRDGSVAQKGEQPNLILDRALNTIFTLSNNQSSVGSVGSIQQTAYWGEFRWYLALGTGSTAPAVTQTALAAEVVRANNNGGFTAEQTNTVAFVGNALVGTFVQVRVVDITASYNLTEFGFGDQAATTVNIRELFRDGNGNPITLSVQAGQQVKITHTLTVSLPAVSGGTDASFDVTGIGTLAGKATWFMVNGTSQQVLLDFFAIYLVKNGQLARMTTANTMDRATLGGSNDTTSIITVNTAQTYVANSYKNVKRFVFSTAQANGTHFGWFVGYTSSNNPVAGYKFGLVTPASIAKTSTYKLTLDFEFSLGRA